VSDYPAIRYAQGRKIAGKVDAEVTCGRCLAGPQRGGTRADDRVEVGNPMTLTNW
jgi:hypothetical protein